MLKRLRAKCFLNLAPPVPPAFQRNNVLPDREFVLLKFLAQGLGEARAVLARVGDKDAGRGRVRHHTHSPIPSLAGFNTANGSTIAGGTARRGRGREWNYRLIRVSIATLAVLNRGAG